MNSEIIEQTKEVFNEVIEKANLKKDDILVIGCSTSEINGSPMGTDSNLALAKDVYSAFYDTLKSMGVYMAVQCCEHLNRALVVEKSLATIKIPLCCPFGVKSSSVS